jgi:hypothetical protein
MLDWSKKTDKSKKGKL